MINKVRILAYSFDYELWVNPPKTFFGTPVPYDAIQRILERSK